MDQLPEFVQFGWLGPEAAREEIEKMRPSGLVVSYAEALERGLLRRPAPPEDPFIKAPIWELCKKVLGHDLLPGKQETGDCVSWGIKQAGERRQVIEIAAGQEERFRPWFAPWIYAVSRNQIGGGLSGDGSLGIWGAKAIAKYGVLFADDEGVPPYSGRIADSWGPVSYTHLTLPTN